MTSCSHTGNTNSKGTSFRDEIRLHYQGKMGEGRRGVVSQSGPECEKHPPRIASCRKESALVLFHLPTARVGAKNWSFMQSKGAED